MRGQVQIVVSMAFAQRVHGVVAPQTIALPKVFLFVRLPAGRASTVSLNGVTCATRAKRGDLGEAPARKLRPPRLRRRSDGQCQLRHATAHRPFHAVDITSADPAMVGGKRLQRSRHTRGIDVRFSTVVIQGSGSHSESGRKRHSERACCGRRARRPESGSRPRVDRLCRCVSTSSA